MPPDGKDGARNPADFDLEPAITALHAGRLTDAEHFCRAVLTAHPGHAEAAHLLGALHLQGGQFEMAEKLIARAIAGNADDPIMHVNRGIALGELGRHADAIASFDRAIQLDPGSAEAFNNRGVAQGTLGRAHDALFSFDQAIALRPHYVAGHNHRGDMLLALGRAADALASFDRADVLQPGCAETLHRRGLALEALGRYDAAFLAYDRAFALEPHGPFLEGARLHAKMHCCDWRDFETESARLLDHVDQGKAVAAPYIILPLASDARQQRLCAERFSSLRYPAGSQPQWGGEVYTHDKIRVAYMSSALREHPTAVLMSGLFEHHDRLRFETFALSCWPDDGSPARQRLNRAFDHFLDMSANDDLQIAQTVRRLEIDILVDLDGFILRERTAVLAHRAAPLQVSYLGYPSTGGAPYRDYLIADRIVAPFEEAPWFAERLVHLPDCYQPNTGRSPVGTPPSRAQCGLPQQGFVFCCFNNSYKITPDIFAVWMRLLRQIEGSVLWLLDANAAMQTNLTREAWQHGIAADRLIFAPRVVLDAHLVRQQVADLFLDTRYYGAHTTASDALWAGLPVLTCSGPAFPGRVGASLLRASGLPELITDTLADYEALALALARQTDLLASLRARLARSRDTAPLFDTVRITRYLEQAYRTMWERQRQGEVPESFAIPA